MLSVVGYQLFVTRQSMTIKSILVSFIKMKKEIKKVTVYAASSAKVAPKYFEAAKALGKTLAQHDITTVYGAGEVGLMGALANSALAEGGEVVGIIPQFMIDVEWGHKGITETIITETMRERKYLLYKDADAIAVLPGGCGTLEEVMEVISLKRLGRFFKPIIFINTDGYYDPLIQMLERCVEEKFMQERHAEMWQVLDDPTQIVDMIRQTEDWDENAIEFAVLGVENRK